MKLFEIDSGAALEVLRLKLNQADKAGIESTLPPYALKNLFRNFELGFKFSKDGMNQLKNELDPAGAVIDSVEDDGSLVLNTKKLQQAKDTGTKGGRSIDQLATRGAKQLNPDIDNLASRGAKQLNPDIDNLASQGSKKLR